MPFTWTNHYADRARAMTASEIREILKVAGQPGMISFAGGIPAAEFFPYEEIQETYHQLFQDIEKRAHALQYSISEGYFPLRQWVCDQLGAEGLTATPDNIFITSGSQQGLDFLGKLMINQGTSVIVESPSYLGGIQALGAYGPEFLTVPIDNDGMQIDQLETQLKKKPGLLYIMPTFQNPGGVTLPLSRRERLIELIHQYQVPLLEDNPYGRLRYEGEDLPSLLHVDAMAHGGAVENAGTIALGSFSKVLVPGLRVGWITAPEAVVRRLVMIKQAADLHTSTINQMVVHEMLVQDFFDEHIRKLRDVYRARRDAMLGALEANFPPGITWTHPQGGMFLWVWLPDGLDGTALLERSLAEAKVAFVPGEAFYVDRSVKNALRLNFSMMPPDRIEEGIRRLGQLMATVIPA